MSNSHPLGLFLLLQGVRIPTLGSFDVVQTETLVGNKTVILQRPVFHLARNIGEGQNLENKDDLAGKTEDLTPQVWGAVGNHTTFLRAPPGKHLWGSASIPGFPGDKQQEPLKYARVAMEASVSRRKVESCILGTTSLLHHCLENGMSVAFVLNDVGVLLIKGSKVQMRFYLDLLEKVMGHRIQDRATLKVSLLFLSAAVPQHCWMGTRGWGQAGAWFHLLCLP